MKKRVLSWLLTLSLVLSLVPPIPVRAAAQSSAEITGWPSAENLKNDVLTTTITNDVTPTSSITVQSGKTLIVKGTGALRSSTNGNKPLFIVESGGHLVLDEVTITDNTVGTDGAVYVKKGGLLDLGYNDQSIRHAPGISGNTSGGTARNLVIADGATVHLNAAAEKKIGVTGVNADGSEFSGKPISVIEGGRYTIKGDNDTFENKESNITADSATLNLTISSAGSHSGDVNKTAPLTLQYVNDHLILVSSRINVLVWDPIRYWNNVEHSSQTYDGAIYQTINKIGTGNLYGNLYRNGTPSSPLHMSETNVKAFEQFDMIVLNYPTIELQQYEITALNNFLGDGGRIFMQFENPHTNVQRKNTLIKGQAIAEKLKAEFSIDDTQWVAGDAPVEVNSSSTLTKGLMNHKSGMAAYIYSDSDSVTWLFKGTTTNNKTSFVLCDQNAGNKNGEKWGALTICGDGVYFDYNNSAFNKIGKQLLDNLLENSRKHRLIAATGVNPNKQINPQATTTTTTETKEYSTPYAALQKATETNTITLLTHSNAALTPTRDELLFEKATLAYEANSTYVGSTIHADTAGVYLDITKTGEVNLRDEAGTVTVTPKNADYVLTLGGTMDETGTQITGGITIKSDKPYTLNANDANSPITEANHGTASIKAVSKGDTFTVTYPGGEVTTYTAKYDGEVIYLGKYVVDYTTLSNNIVREYQDDDPRSHAHHGHDFTQHFTAASGFELKGQAIEVKTYTTDKANPTTYNMKQSADTVPGEKTVYVSDEKDSEGKPKVVITQYHEQLGSALRNGKVTVTVRDVRENIIVTQKGDTTEAVDPIIYVVGVGKNGGRETPLWSYTTQRSGKDGQTTKNVDGWPWAKWKVSGVKTALGTEAEYKAGTLTNWTPGNLTIPANASDIASYEISLLKGDTVVVFEYEWDMVEVKINAKLGTGPSDAVDFPNFTPQSAEVQRDVQSTILAPTIAGYQADRTSQPVTPTKNPVTGKYEPEEVTFYYTLSSSTVLYRAVDAEGHELATWNGPRVIQGDPVSTDWSNAPKLAGYQVVQQAGVATAENNGTTDRFDGQNRITVTWKYEPKTRDVVIKMVEYTDSGNHRGQELRTDTQSYAKSPVGFTLNLTAPAIPGYTVKVDAGNVDISAGKTVFVEDTVSADPIEVYFYYEQDVDNSAAITVQLWDQTNSKEIYSYKVDGVNGVKTLIRVPTYQGYKSVNNQPVSIAPDENISYGAGVVRFNYVPDTIKVTVQLVDSSKTPNDDLKAKVPNYTFTYDVVRGETLKLVAPSIYGYVLQSSQIGSAAPVENTPVVEVVTTGASVDQTVTFSYNTLDESMIHIHVKGVDKDGITRYEYTKLVKKGTQTDTVTAFPVIGQKLVSATVAGTENINSVQNGNLTFTVTAAAGSTQEILFTYADNTAEVKINATLNGAAFPNYTAPTVRQEIGTTVTYQAPALPGYVPIDPASKDHKATGTNDAVSFDYAKAKGNVIYRAVDEQGGEIGILKTVTIAKDAAVDTAVGNATADYGMYKLKNTSAAGTASAATYNGKDDVTVDFVYVRKAKTIKIEMVDEAGGSIGTETLADQQTGQTITVNAPTKTGYTPVINAQNVFVTNSESEAQTVKFVYRTNPDKRATYTIHLIDGSKTAPNNIIQVLTMPGTKGVESTITAPTLEGYLAGDPASVTRKPEDGMITFTYQPDVRTVKVKFVDAAGAEITGVDANIAKSYTVKRGETLTVYAPSIKGYALQSTEAIVKTLTTANIFDDGKTEISFKYDVVEQELYVTHTVKFMADGHLLYWHNKLVPKGNGQIVSYTPDMINYVPLGYKYQNISYEKATGADLSGVPTGTAIGANDVKDDMNAIITYHFAEDSAHIKIEMVMKGDTTPFATKTITGYRAGQTVEVVAPARDGKILVGDLIKEVRNLQVGENKVTFEYTDPGKVTLQLIEKGGAKDGEIIRVLSPNQACTYTAGQNDLDLSAAGYTFVPNGSDAPFNQANGSLNVTTDMLTNGASYKIYYTKNTRDVTYVLKNVENGSEIKRDVHTGAARVGETYVAAAPQLTGYTLVGDVTKIISKVESTGELTVEFTYRQKSSGDIEVIFKGEDGKTILSYTASAAVGETFTAKAPATLEDGKYVTASGAEETKSLTVAGGTGTQAQRIEFTYKNNFVKVTTQTKLGTNTATAHGTPYEVVKGNTAPQIQAGTLTLTPPSMGGYVLKGITLSGGKTGGGETSFPTEWDENANALTLTDLTSDVTVVYHYITVEENIGAYQSVIMVKAEYRGFQMGTDKQQTVTRNVGTTITPDPYDGYRVTGYKLDGGALTGGTSLTFTPRNPTHNVIFVYERTDGAVVLPGKDNKIGGEDDVIVKPDGGKNLEDVDNPAGSVKVPTGETGTVTRPDPSDPNHPNGKKEDIKVPEGTIVKPDGTIELPKNPDGSGGGTINPGDKLPENTPTGYITIIYQPNGGTGDVVKQLAKNDATLKTIVNPFAAPGNATFNGWDTNAGGSGTNYAAGAPITGVTGKSLTLYAQWLKGEGTNVVTITYKPNGGTPDTDDVQKASDNTGTSFRMMLRLSSFTVPGWNFGGWNTVANGSGDQYEPNTEVTVTMGNNWTLYAQWYRVNPDGSITVPGKDGNPNTPENNATAKGDGKGNNPTRDPATGNIEIPKGGSVTIGDETLSLPDGGILKPDGTVIINRPDGNSNGKPDGTITVPGKDGTTPDVKDESGNEVSPKPTVFTVTYQSNNGENKTAKSYAVANEDFTIMPNPFTYTGYTFLRWMKDKTNFYDAGQSVNATENLTLKAMWAKVNSDGSITVPGPDGRIDTDNDNTTVNPNDDGDKPKFTGTPVPGSVIVPDGATVDTPTGPVIPPDGSVVLPDGTIVAPDNNGSVNPGETIYPDNKRPTDENNRTYFTVTYQYDANGGSDIAGQSKVYQSARKADGVTVLPNRFLTPNGMSFKGWKAGDGTTYQPGENLKSNSDVTLTAIYEQPTGVQLLTVDPPISSANQNSAIQLTAKKNSAATTDVNWTAQKLTGGNLNSAINASGRLTVPANAADGDIIIVTATDKTDPNLAASAYVAVNVPISVNPGGGSSGGTTTKTYTITATAGAHGSIDPEGKVSVKGGSDKVFTISPNNGYRIEDVRVDGRSVGTVSYYVFSNVDENHTISVTFAEARPANNNGIADPSETGVANWLRVTEHSAFMNGFGNGLFGPSDNITRAQTAQMFYNLLVNKDVPVTISFTDVADGAWCAEAVKTLASLGIVNGLGNGTFAPNRQITRAEFTVIATRFAKVNANATNMFTDVNPSDWYYSAISTAASYGWIAGMADGSFQPGAKITRAQAATIVNRMLARACDRSFTGNVKNFVDVSTDHWAYYQIMEATNSHTHRYDADGYETWTGLN